MFLRRHSCGARHSSGHKKRQLTHTTVLLSTWIVARGRGARRVFRWHRTAGVPRSNDYAVSWVTLRVQGVLSRYKGQQRRVSASGDRVSGIEGEYGLTARYRDVYVGWAASRDGESKGLRPTASRLFFGLTWGTGRREERSTR